MNARLNLFGSPVVAKALGHYSAVAPVLIGESALPKTIQNLVMIRASQINGDSYATDVHTKNAAQSGESATRINLVAAWRETSVFTAAECAALELAEQGTRIADGAGGVTDAAWAQAAAHYDEDQLAALVVFIALINATNRFAVMNRQRGGDYQPAAAV
ncbi:carboxymuconolactone decarboxylase family protein [Nocardia yamanashiensis]|uniref:carboxymuconolactone decarboxylase family protein n=1 Tax=Nocardia yamanashiensis TaxID=209247 RepID=UPI00082D001F|nr:carboxymuconolactone decarboxylase family protein [Nocardia yamanashiensis]